MDSPRQQQNKTASTTPSKSASPSLVSSSLSPVTSNFGPSSSALHSAHNASEHTHGCGCPKLPNGQGGFFGK